MGSTKPAGKIKIYFTHYNKYGTYKIRLDVE